MSHFQKPDKGGFGTSCISIRFEPLIQFLMRGELTWLPVMESMITTTEAVVYAVHWMTIHPK
ncbi:hypothetical protein [Halobacillus salinus]|uniref:Uncharacterized protein n=1 Tax=Halobacillus salinus TaxID=192814 RepID=A0A4Z0H0M8_9BACI|nr:hypothetical protein [Halobacillus salinus]TGB03670.1 hypothetical protein E4663_01310 [Halobacillus salinus]